MSGRACVVTGGSGAIGSATALRLVAEGASVLLTGRAEKRLGAVAQAAERERGAGARVSSLALDVTVPDAGELAVAACLERFGRLDMLVNGAGMTRVLAIDEIPDAEWQAHWELHVLAPMRMMRAAVPVMARARWGRIVNVSSSSGKRPGQRNVAYSVTKAALLSRSRAYADAYASRGVLINAITPGPIGADLWLAPGGLVDQTVSARGGTREQVLEQAAQGLPVGRLEAGHSENMAAVDVAAIGWRFAPSTYAIGREKIVEYALATGETNRLHLDLAAARDAGYPDLVAPPMFAAVYQGRAVAPGLFDPELGIDFARLVHSAQEFGWDRLALAGDEVTTTVIVKDIAERAGMGVYAFEARTVNQRGEPVATGVWTNVVRKDR